MQSPLHEPGAETAGYAAGGRLCLSERPFLGHYALRGRADEPAFLAGAAAALGCDLPLAPNHTATVAAPATEPSTVVLWLAPDEWLVLAPQAQRAALRDALTQAVADKFAALNDLSGGQTVIRVAGADAAALLARGCTLDLHPRQFTPGQCAQTLLARVNVTLLPAEHNGGPLYDVIVRRSFADYLWRWLKDAAIGLEEA